MRHLHCTLVSASDIQKREHFNVPSEQTSCLYPIAEVQCVHYNAFTWGRVEDGVVVCGCERWHTEGRTGDLCNPVIVILQATTCAG